MGIGLIALAHNLRKKQLKMARNQQTYIPLIGLQETAVWLIVTDWVLVTLLKVFKRVIIYHQ
jgi:hypothetical protein